MLPPELKAQLANLQSFIVATGFILVLDVLIYKACLSVYTETYGRKEARRRAYGISPAELTAAVESSVPSGAVMHFAMQSAPTGWLKADGSAVSRTQYPALFAAIGTTFGVGDGRTTFNLPDLRGEFVRGWDGGRNIDPGRAFGSAQGDAIRNITGSIDTGSNNGHQLFDEATATGALAISQRRWKAWTSDTQDGRNNPSAFDFDASRVVPTAAENRPRNIALLACIKI